MLGLGLGALLGGELADRFPIGRSSCSPGSSCPRRVWRRQPALIHLVSHATVSASTLTVAAANFGLLLCPTLLMGRRFDPREAPHAAISECRRVGGALYFANTMGAALGGVHRLRSLYYLGLNATLYIAVGLNMAVAAVVGLTLRERHV